MLSTIAREHYQRAFEEDVVIDDALQARLTETILMPQLARIIHDVGKIRAIFDNQFNAVYKKIAVPDTTPYGITSPQNYPIGFCRFIRDRLFEILEKSPMFTKFRQQGILLKKVYIILDNRYYQNAIQLGTLYLDVANDTVDRRKKQVVCQPFEDLKYSCFENYDTCFRVGENYHNVKLYPNLLLPAIAPIFPLFAISEDGELNLFDSHMVIAYKNVVHKYRPIVNWIQSSPYMQRRLPLEYAALLRTHFVRHQQRDLAFQWNEKTTPKNVLDFIAHKLERQGARQDECDQQILAMALHLRHHISGTRLRPSAEEVANLRTGGLIPKVKNKP